MPLPLQAKMLRFLQERVIERIGGRQAIPVDVRIVAATNKELEAAVGRGEFRQDLYYRIAEVAIPIPPLRERDGDALLIANALLRNAGKRHGRPDLRFSSEAARAIGAHRWAGNVRELENAVNRAAIMAEAQAITASELGLPVPAEGEGADPGFVNLRDVRLRAETQALQKALALSGGNLSRAAELLGIARPTLYDLMERAGLAPGNG